MFSVFELECLLRRRLTRWIDACLLPLLRPFLLYPIFQAASTSCAAAAAAAVMSWLAPSLRQCATALLLRSALAQSVRARAPPPRFSCLCLFFAPPRGGRPVMFSRARALNFSSSALPRRRRHCSLRLLLGGLGLLYVHEVLPPSSEAARFHQTVPAFRFFTPVKSSRAKNRFRDQETRRVGFP